MIIYIDGKAVEVGEVAFDIGAHFGQHVCDVFNKTVTVPFTGLGTPPLQPIAEWIEDVERIHRQQWIERN